LRLAVTTQCYAARATFQSPTGRTLETHDHVSQSPCPIFGSSTTWPRPRRHSDIRRAPDHASAALGDAAGLKGRRGTSQETLTASRSQIRSCGSRCSGRRFFPRRRHPCRAKDPVASGSATVVTIPSSAPTGVTEITCSGQDANGEAFVLGTTISIAAAGIVTAFTGAQLEVWMFLAISLFGVGLGLILISRRRRTNALR
jgi:hypothetical protein